MTAGIEWQGKVGEVWAQQWRHTDRTLAAVNDALIAAAVSARPEDDALTRQILDLGCGAGATSLAIAEAFPDAQVLGIDLSPDLIDVARSRAVENPRCRFAVADAAHWEDPKWSPNLVVSRHGVMFFDDPVAAFAQRRRHSAPGASLLFSCFQDRGRNDWANLLDGTNVAIGAADAIPHVDSIPEVGPFAFANPDCVRQILSAAGWEDATATPLDVPFVVGAGADPVADALDYFRHIGPAARLLHLASESEREALDAHLQARLLDNVHAGEVRFTAAIWIWTARAPDTSE